MPKARAPAALVDTATKCLATALSSPSACNSQARATSALLIVSCVVNVLDETTNSVSAASRSCVASVKAAPWTLETKRKRRLRSLYGRNARCAISGPRYDPPMPILTMLRMRLPVCPFQTPVRTRVAESAMRASTACTSGTTLRPSTSITASAGARRAVWRTARFSVTLILSPRNMASRLAASPRSSASRVSRAMVSGVMRFFE